MGVRGRSNLTDEHTFFVSTTVVNSIPVFKDFECCNILVHNIRHYQSRYKFNILGYVIMPTHFHWIVFLENFNGTISDIMRDIKKYSAWDLLEHISKTNTESNNQFLRTSSSGQKRQLWMHRFDDEVIRNEKMFWQKLKYIHNNPVKAELVKKPEDYTYSSARNYILDDNSVLPVDTGFVGSEMVDLIA